MRTSSFFESGSHTNFETTLDRLQERRLSRARMAAFSIRDVRVRAEQSIAADVISVLGQNSEASSDLVHSGHHQRQ